MMFRPGAEWFTKHLEALPEPHRIFPKVNSDMFTPLLNLLLYPSCPYRTTTTDNHDVAADSKARCLKVCEI